MALPPEVIERFDKWAEQNNVDLTVFSQVALSALRSAFWAGYMQGFRENLGKGDD